MEEGLISGDWFVQFGLLPEREHGWSEHGQVAGGEFEEVGLVVVEEERLGLLLGAPEEGGEYLEDVYLQDVVIGEDDE